MTFWASICGLVFGVKSMSGYHNRFFDNKMAFRANMMITGGFLTLLSWNLRVNYAKRTTFLIHFGVFFEMGSKMDHVVHPRRVCVKHVVG